MEIMPLKEDEPEINLSLDNQIHHALNGQNEELLELEKLSSCLTIEEYIAEMERLRNDLLTSQRKI